jgi:flagellin
MSSVINTNVKSLIAQNSLTTNNRKLSEAMESLSTGKRINSAADDAAGLAISDKMTAHVRGLNQAVRNANDAISLIQTAEGALVEVTNMLQRMRELAVQSANDTNTSDDRNFLDQEFQSLKNEINRISRNTQWNGMNLLDGTFLRNPIGGTASLAATNVSGQFNFQVGANRNQLITHTFADFDDQVAVAQVGSISIMSNPALTSTAYSGAVVGSGAVVRVTINNTVISLAPTSATSGLVAELGADLASAINNNSALSQLVNAAYAGSNITLKSLVNGTEFTVLTNLTQAESSLGYQTSVYNSSRGWSVIANAGVQNQVDSQNAIGTMDAALQIVNKQRSAAGATINRLTYAADNLANISTNTQASRSRILDADYASTTTELARSQIIQQAATAMLAQANQQPQMVLSLLK